MLKQRIITAVILLFVLGGLVVFLPPMGFLVLLLLVLTIASWEWAALLDWELPRSRIVFALSMAAVMVVCGYVAGMPNEISIPSLAAILLVSLLFWILATLAIVSYPKTAALWSGKVPRLADAVIILVSTFIALAFIRLNEHGLWYLFYMVGVVCAADIGAYFTGKNFGKRKLAPKVSPAKSWEGFIGGLASTMLLAFLVNLSVEMPAHVIYPATLLTAVASALGDLHESMLKRHTGIKDSSQLLPGHGGVLDRMDSLLSATPVFAFCMIVAGV